MWNSSQHDVLHVLHIACSACIGVMEVLGDIPPYSSQITHVLQSRPKNVDHAANYYREQQDY